MFVFKSCWARLIMMVSSRCRNFDLDQNDHEDIVVCFNGCSNEKNCDDISVFFRLLTFFFKYLSYFCWLDIPYNFFFNFRNFLTRSDLFTNSSVIDSRTHPAYFVLFCFAGTSLHENHLFFLFFLLLLSNFKCSMSFLSSIESFSISLFNLFFFYMHAKYFEKLSLLFVSVLLLVFSVKW